MSWRDRIAQAIRAFHGSPHDFDKFSAEYIGKGEGNQAYGSGLYFAGNENIARHYRDALQSNVAPHVLYEGDRVNPSMIRSMRGSAEPEERWLAENYAPLLLSRRQAPLDVLRGDIEKATQQRDMWLARKDEHLADPPIASTYGPSDFDQFAAAQQAKIDRLNYVLPRLDWNKGGGTGKMYEVNINADPDQLLKWDVPFSQQSDFVQNAVYPALVGRETARRKAINTQLDNAPTPFTSPTMIAKEDARREQLRNALDVPFEDAIANKGGENVYRAMGLPAVNQPQGYRQSSAKLQDIGVPGLSYLDASSRGRGTGTNNYVMFDDSLIDIMKKYGMAGVVPGMGALAAQDQYSEASP